VVIPPCLGGREDMSTLIDRVRATGKVDLVRLQ
jgi:hypothetical protein